jgi:hypothetical protein
LKWKRVNAPFHVPALISIGKPAYKQLVKSRAGDHAELAQLGHRIGQTPVRDAHAHAALDDFGKLHHLWIVSQNLLRQVVFSSSLVAGSERKGNFHSGIDLPQTLCDAIRIACSP